MTLRSLQQGQAGNEHSKSHLNSCSGALALGAFVLHHHFIKPPFHEQKIPFFTLLKMVVQHDAHSVKGSATYFTIACTEDIGPSSNLCVSSPNDSLDLPIRLLSRERRGHLVLHSLVPTPDQSN